MKRIGFVGLGLMGAPMVRRLAHAGYDVAVTSRRRASADAVAVQGVQWVDSAVELSDRDIVVTMLPRAEDVYSVLFGADGLLTGDAKPRVIVDMSTIGVARVQRIAEEARSRGVGFVDAPVSGGPPAAESGQLAIMAGGAPEVFAEVDEVLTQLGSARLLGPSGSGQAAKLANQMLIAGIMGGMTDALEIVNRSDLDVASWHAAVASGFGGSPLLGWALGRILEGDNAPGFKIAHLLKDLDLALESLPDGSVVADAVRTAYQRLGERNWDAGTQALPASRLEQTEKMEDHD